MTPLRRVQIAIICFLLIPASTAYATRLALSLPAANINIEQVIGTPDLIFSQAGGAAFSGTTCILMTVASAERSRFLSIFLYAKTMNASVYLTYDENSSSCAITSYGLTS